MLSVLRRLQATNCFFELGVPLRDSNYGSHNTLAECPKQQVIGE